MYRGEPKRPANRYQRKNKQSKGGQKVGSDARAAQNVGGKGDFGVHAGEAADRTERLVASEETKRQDKHLAGHEPRSGAADTRTSGVGGNESGPGSSSGGDIDTDVIGVGAGGTGLAQSGPQQRTAGPDMTTGLPTTGEPAKKHGDKLATDRALAAKRAGKRTIVSGSTLDREGDARTTGPGQGADAVTNPSARGDDSFAGEISGGEAGGQDNSLAEQP